jgi:hypothetical protein
MTLKTQLTDELKRLAGKPTQAVQLSGPDGVDLAIDFIAVDSMSCAFRELRLHVPALVGAGLDPLKQWAEDLSKRITYLLENIGPIEIDPALQQVLIRSNPPDKQAGTTRFYEILLQSQSNGNFSLRRYLSEKGQPGRSQVDMQTTHEVLVKLVNDLVETIPAP